LAISSALQTNSTEHKAHFLSIMKHLIHLQN
jgi:hypothetical protein